MKDADTLAKLVALTIIKAAAKAKAEHPDPLQAASISIAVHFVELMAARAASHGDMKGGVKVAVSSTQPGPMEEIASRLQVALNPKAIERPGPANVHLILREYQTDDAGGPVVEFSNGVLYLKKALFGTDADNSIFQLQSDKEAKQNAKELLAASKEVEAAFDGLRESKAAENAGEDNPTGLPDALKKLFEKLTGDADTKVRVIDLSGLMGSDDGESLKASTHRITSRDEICDNCVVLDASPEDSVHTFFAFCDDVPLGKALKWIRNEQGDRVRIRVSTTGKALRRSGEITKVVFE